MPASLFVEHLDSGIAFYINGELQFHTADEQIYHEYLVVPAIALALRRFFPSYSPFHNEGEEGLRVLICGGGDGLAARDILRFSEVSYIDLIDYNPDVLQLGRTTFAPFNQNSLTHPKVQVCEREAFNFLSNLAREIKNVEQGTGETQNSSTPHTPHSIPYHVVICDFTYPGSIEDTQVYSREWFQLVRQVLHPKGIIATNGVSPDRNTKGFWCLYQTILSSGLAAKPLQLSIPSFQDRGYGDWGFLLASTDPISRSELTDITLPDGLQALDRKKLLASFVFSKAIADVRTSVHIHTRDSSQLFYYLLNDQGFSIRNSVADSNNAAVFEEISRVDFLAIDEPCGAIVLSEGADPLSLEFLVRVWLDQIERADWHRQGDRSGSRTDLLLPVQHPYHTPKMTAEWLRMLKQLLAQVDLPQLLKSILERSQELPPRLVRDLKQLLATMQRADSTQYTTNLDTQSDASNLSIATTTTANVLIALSLTLLVANIVAPDSVFAKSSFASSGSGTDDGGLGWLGLMMTIGGVSWLMNLMNEKN